MLQPANTYKEVYGAFRWQIPEYYNIGVDVCDKWAEERYRLALIYEDETGTVDKYSFWDMQLLSNRLANVLEAHGIERGDRVGILLPQRPERTRTGAHRDLQARGHCGPALHLVRPGGPRVPSGQQ